MNTNKNSKKTVVALKVRLDEQNKGAGFKALVVEGNSRPVLSRSTKPMRSNPVPFARKVQARRHDCINVANNNPATDLHVEGEKYVTRTTMTEAQAVEVAKALNIDLGSEEQLKLPPAIKEGRGPVSSLHQQMMEGKIDYKEFCKRAERIAEMKERKREEYLEFENELRRLAMERAMAVVEHRKQLDADWAEDDRFVGVKPTRGLKINWAAMTPAQKEYHLRKLDMWRRQNEQQCLQRMEQALGWFLERRYASEVDRAAKLMCNRGYGIATPRWKDIEVIDRKTKQPVTVARQMLEPGYADYDAMFDRCEWLARKFEQQTRENLEAFQHKLAMLFQVYERRRSEYVEARKVVELPDIDAMVAGDRFAMLMGLSRESMKVWALVRVALQHGSVPAKMVDPMWKEEITVQDVALIVARELMEELATAPRPLRFVDSDEDLATVRLVESVKSRGRRNGIKEMPSDILEAQHERIANKIRATRQDDFLAEALESELNRRSKRPSKARKTKKATARQKNQERQQQAVKVKPVVIDLTEAAPAVSRQAWL